MYAIGAKNAIKNLTCGFIVHREIKHIAEIKAVATFKTRESVLRYLLWFVVNKYKKETILFVSKGFIAGQIAYTTLGCRESKKNPPHKFSDFNKGSMKDEDDLYFCLEVPENINPCS